jgi:hypothetical protein
MEYYYVIDDKQKGPVDLNTMLTEIDAETLVYREGIEWTVAKDVPELYNYFASHLSNSLTPPQSQKSNKATGFQVEPDVTSVNKPTMFSNVFSFDGRIRRLEYGISLIIYYFGYTVILLSDTEILYLILIPMVWFILAQGAKRCHDRGNSGWYQIIPFYIFWMLFADSENCTNGYGIRPK